MENKPNANEVLREVVKKRDRLIQENKILKSKITGIRILVNLLDNLLWEEGKKEFGLQRKTIRNIQEIIKD